MRFVRLLAQWITVIVAVVGWILLVPLFNVLAQVLNRLPGLVGVGLPHGRGALVDRAGFEPTALQPSYEKEPGKRAA